MLGVQEILSALRDDDVSARAPPAAKAVVESLPQKNLQESELAALGTDSSCPVCM